VGETYPQSPAARDRWILSRRPPRNRLDPSQPYAYLAEQERSAAGEVVAVATLFLTNRECPWRCAMCDLWKNTLPGPTPLGAIPAQIDFALHRLPACRQIKLYNSGSFFDPGAIPKADHEAITARVRGFERVIVECHPALVGEECVRFGERLEGELEVAMGLETANPAALEKLNKRMTVEQFAKAAEFLRCHGMALRTFVLVKPPFVQAGEASEWVRRSIEFAFDCGSTVVSLIPTRFGNGSMEELARLGQFTPPTLGELEQAATFGIGLRRGRVFADLWDLAQFSRCPHCLPERTERLSQMNLMQIVPARQPCPCCAQ
jgi:radical SAM enzyme (TIGR01210 family)